VPVGSAARAVVEAAGDADAPAGGLPRPLGRALSAARSAGAALARPDRLVGPALSTVAGLPATARQTGQALGIAASMLRNAVPPAPGSPWTAAHTSPERGLAMLRIDLQDVHRIRRRHGGTVNDVLLTVVTGALRRWLADRGRTVDEMSLRALVPVSRPQRCVGSNGGNSLSGYLCTLPVGEPDPLIRLQAVRAEMDRNKAAGPGRGAGALPVLADRLPAAVHRLAGPFAGRGASLLFDTIVTSVPLPNLSLHLTGAELREIYPVVPLAHGHALGIAVSTYRGTAHLTLHADRQAMPDLTRLAAAVPAALTALDRVPHAS
jgi:WS/DGAT/MGAT family acyltransferase